MVVLETSLRSIQQQTKLSEKQLQDILTQIGFDIDHLDGDELKIDITPERLDALSTQGIIRILRSFEKKKNPVYVSNPSLYELHIDSSVKAVRPQTVCAVVTNLNFTDQTIKDIIWVQEKLHATIGKERKRAAIGVYPLEKISWPITFCAKKPNDIAFEPLEGTKQMSGLQILQEHPAGKKYAHLLEGAKVFPLFTDADGQILSMPPIINSHTVGKVDQTTTGIFIEVSGFDIPVLEHILVLLSCLFIDMGGKVHQVTVIDGKQKRATPKLEEQSYAVSVQKINAHLGTSLTAKQAANLLEKMGHRVVIDGEMLQIHVLPYRYDIWHAVDLIDDVLRALGANSIELQYSHSYTKGSMTKQNHFIEQITRHLIGFGLQEVKTLGVTDKDDQFTKMNLPVVASEFIALGSTAERNINMLRTWLLPELLKTLHYNRSVVYPQMIFEVGDVIIPAKTDVCSKNQLHVAIALCADTAPYTQIRQLIDSIFATFGYDVQIDSFEHKSFIKGRCARVMYKGKQLAFFGEIHPDVLENWGLSMPVCACEIICD
ncbi:MAG: phenylalanine--tRNA ligase subunit beta [Candidatus Woesearchaeota archaeon]